MTEPQVELEPELGAGSFGRVFSTRLVANRCAMSEASSWGVLTSRFSEFVGSMREPESHNFADACAGRSGAGL